VIFSLTQLYHYTPEIFLFSTATFKYTYRASLRRIGQEYSSYWQTLSYRGCCIEYTTPRVGFELTILVVIGIDCIVSCKSNYHTITKNKSHTETREEFIGPWQWLWKSMESRVGQKYLAFCSQCNVPTLYRNLHKGSLMWHESGTLQTTFNKISVISDHDSQIYYWRNPSTWRKSQICRKSLPNIIINLWFQLARKLDIFHSDEVLNATCCF
jgi:hypothetical protein